MDKYELLKTYFGHDKFRPGQETLINGLLDGRDVFGVMPTGAGKSMCYQIPALMMPGITLVVSPLISLMKDQVMSLCQAGVPAAYLNSSLTYGQYCEALRRAGHGAYKIIYVAPERLGTEGFGDFARRVPISMVAVDEAHCVSQWGQDFRPSYLQIADFVESLPKRPIVAAFTATATMEVRTDIVNLLRLQDPLSLVTGFDRENLYFAVEQPVNKMACLLELLRKRPGQSGIVYCATRKNVEQVCEKLLDAGFSATRYHAGLDEAERRQNQEDFSFDRKPIMVATNAFGMGIDKSNVSFVIHYNMPKNLESYYQEAGRAGRDGAPADCILLFSNGDVHTAQYFIDNSQENQDFPPQVQAALRKKEQERLRDMVFYCRTTDCLRAHILRYFGESCPDTCGHCGNCLGAYDQIDVTDQAETVIKAIQSLENRYNTHFGPAMVTKFLCGIKDKALGAWHMEELNLFGTLAATPERQVRDMIEQMKAEGYLKEERENGYPVLLPGPAATEITNYGQQVRIRRRLESKPRVKTSVPLAEDAQDLLTALRRVRSRLSQETGIPSYMVFSNATLEDMARIAPTTLDEFLTVKGVGAMKAHRYGGAFLDAIRAYRDNR